MTDEEKHEYLKSLFRESDITVNLSRIEDGVVFFDLTFTPLTYPSVITINLKDQVPK